MISNYVSLDLIIERLNSIKIPGQTWNISELKEWTWQALSKIGEVNRFIENSVEVDVVDNKAILPKNIHEIHSILEASSGFNMDKLNGYEEFRDLTYKINAGVIFTDFDKGSILINGYYFPIDENDKPLIPDNEYFISAVYSFLQMKLGERLMWQNKISPSQFQYLQREWYFYCPAAKNESKMPREDELHSFKRRQLKPFRNMYRNTKIGASLITINNKPRE